MIADRRSIGIVLAGICSFLNLYATQSLLPTLARQFSASPAKVSLTVGATTLAVALIAPFTGIVADVLGRRRVILAAMFTLVLPTVMVSFSATLGQMIFWRFVQGLCLPPIFAVTVAYIGEEWPATEATAITGIYTASSCFGGFLSRFLTGLLAEHFGWRVAFLCVAGLTLACAIGAALFLRRERHFVRSGSYLASSRQLLSHFHNPQLVATFCVGFGVLFSFVAIFTYVNFDLAAPPYDLSAGALGTIFIVYLIGVLLTPLTGKGVALIGRRNLMLVAMAFWLAGLGLLLLPGLPSILAGLTVAAGAGFICQSSSTSYVAITARHARSSAVGLYVTFFYFGGSFGAAVTGLAWSLAGWPGCVACVAVVVIVQAAIVARCWRTEPA